MLTSDGYSWCPTPPLSIHQLWCESLIPCRFGTGSKRSTTSSGSWTQGHGQFSGHWPLEAVSMATAQGLILMDVEFVPLRGLPFQRYHICPNIAWHTNSQNKTLLGVWLLNHGSCLLKASAGRQTNVVIEGQQLFCFPAQNDDYSYIKAYSSCHHNIPNTI